MNKNYWIFLFTTIVTGLIISTCIFTKSKAGSKGLNMHDTALSNGQHDFDFEIGVWNTTLKRLKDPLTGSKTWINYTGTTVVTKVWNGLANLVELDVTGPAGKITALSLRLYDPQTQQWSLNFANSAGGGIATPTIGGFKNGQGIFYDKETFRGKDVLVRFIISDIKANSCHFEQAYSIDEGKTWEVNWIADDTRIINGSNQAQMISKPILTESIARQIVEAAITEAKKNNWLVSIAVVNEGGQLLQFTKMDNTTNASADIAIAKARHSAYYRRDTKFHEDLLTKGNSLVLSLPNSLPVEGGVQLLYKNQLIGAIGVSGVAPNEDGKIAAAGALRLQELFQ